MSSRHQILFSSNYRKRVANLLYIDVLTLARWFTDLLPGPLRNWLMRRVFTRSGPGVFFDRNVYVKFPWLVSIGPRTSVNRGVEFFSDFAGVNGISVGADCYIGPNVRFIAAGHDLDSMVDHVGAQIRVDDDVWLGAGCTLLPGVSIGRNSVVGAGSVVTRDLPADVVAAGVPAVVLRARSSDDRSGPNPAS